MKLFIYHKLGGGLPRHGQCDVIKTQPLGCLMPKGGKWQSGKCPFHATPRRGIK